MPDVGGSCRQNVMSRFKSLNRVGGLSRASAQSAVQDDRRWARVVLCVESVLLGALMAGCWGCERPDQSQFAPLAELADSTHAIVRVYGAPIPLLEPFASDERDHLRHMLSALPRSTLLVGDSYTRRRSKRSRDCPHKKKEPAPSPPNLRNPTEREKALIDLFWGSVGADYGERRCMASHTTSGTCWGNTRARSSYDAGGIRRPSGARLRLYISIPRTVSPWLRAPAPTGALRTVHCPPQE